MIHDGRRILGKSGQVQNAIAGRYRESFMRAENEEVEAKGKERMAICRKEGRGPQTTA
jgi:hypothetical protein